MPAPSLSSNRNRLAFGLVGALFMVEITSGILQGYYIPMITDITGHLGIEPAAFNWFEAAQLLLSALAVPILARLGDLHGHKKILLISTALTAAGTWGLVFTGTFETFLIAWALQGFYAVWLPLEVALIFDRARQAGGNAPTQARKAAGYLVVGLELGAIIGALGGAQVLRATGANIPLTLAVPAVIVTLSFFVILFFVKESTPVAEGGVDAVGFTLLALSLLGITGSLSFLHANGLDTWWAWLIMAAGFALLYPFYRHVTHREHPAIDLTVLRAPAMWPIQVTALLGGVSLLGAQIPLSTFAAADPANGYGLGLDASVISYMTGGYLLSLMVGAVLQPIAAERFSPRTAIIGAACVNASGYLLFIPFHHTMVQVLTALCIAGLGSGALVAAIPAAAAAAAPDGQAGIASGLTNTAKVVGGAFASATFGMLLATGVATSGVATSSLAGYLTVWTICGLTALAAAVVLYFVPKDAFTAPVSDAEDEVLIPPVP